MTYTLDTKAATFTTRFVQSHLGTVHNVKAEATGPACGAKVSLPVRNAEAMVTCGRCAKAMAKAQAEAVPALFEVAAEAEPQAVAVPVAVGQGDNATLGTAEAVTAERLAEARAARRAALVAKRWAEAKAATAKRLAEAKAAERWAQAEAAEALAEAEAKRKAQAVAKVAKAKAEAERWAEAQAQHAAKRAEVMAERAAKRAEAMAEAKAKATEAARIAKAVAATDRALGGHWAARIGVDMPTLAIGAMAQDEAMAEAARAMGRDSRALAEDWAEEKDAMRVRRGQRAAEHAIDLALFRRTKDEVLAYRSGTGYALGRKVLATLGRDVMAVVIHYTDADLVTVADAVPVPRNLGRAVASAERAAKVAAERLAQADAKADTAKRAKAAEASTKAEAKVMAARAEAGKWAEASQFRGVALVKVAQADAVTLADADAMELIKAQLSPRWDLAKAEVMKGAPTRVLADTTATKATKAANGTVTPEAKREATKARVAAYRARQRAAKGQAEARGYNASVRNAK